MYSSTVFYKTVYDQIIFQLVSTYDELWYNNIKIRSCYLHYVTQLVISERNNDNSNSSRLWNEQAQ